MNSKNCDKKVIGIIGSPRREGNTDILVSKVLEGAKKAGASVEKIYLTDLEIEPCRGCNVCVSRKACVIDDDMGPLLEKMGESQVWVLGSPVYWWGPTAQFKAFLDRWHGARHEIMFKDRVMVLVVPLEAKNKTVARYSVGMLKETINWNKSSLFKVIIATDVNEKGAVRFKQNVMNNAYKAGLSVIKNCEKNVIKNVNL